MVTRLSNTVIDTQFESQFKYLPHESSALNFVLTGGSVPELAGNATIAKQTIALTDDSTNRVYVDYSVTPAVISQSTSIPSTALLLYEVVTASGAVTSVTDARWKSFNNRFLTPTLSPSTLSQGFSNTGSETGVTVPTGTNRLLVVIWTSGSTSNYPTAPTWGTTNLTQVGVDTQLAGSPFSGRTACWKMDESTIANKTGNDTLNIAGSGSFAYAILGNVNQTTQVRGFTASIFQDVSGSVDYPFSGTADYIVGSQQVRDSILCMINSFAGTVAESDEIVGLTAIGDNGGERSAHSGIASESSQSFTYNNSHVNDPDCMGMFAAVASL